MWAKLVEITRLSIFGFSLALAGCDDGGPITELPPTMVLETYAAAGMLLSEKTVGKDDPAYIRLQSLIAREQRGWSASFVSYVPGPYAFRSANLVVRCYPGFLIVDSVNAGRAISRRKDIPDVLAELGLPVARP